MIEIAKLQLVIAADYTIRGEIMGRKAREKKLNKFWDQCLKDAKNATEAEKKQAASIFADLSKKHPVKRSEQFGRALNRVFDDFGDTLGGLVMVEFAKFKGGC